jgi:hypothetical protein
VRFLTELAEYIHFGHSKGWLEFIEFKDCTTKRCIDYRNRIAQVKSQIKDGEAGDNWRLFESAPRDGSKFLAYDVEKKTVWRVYWNGSKWHPSVPTLTHWLPLPPPPNMSDEGSCFRND